MTWKNESHRHELSSKGIKTNKNQPIKINKYNQLSKDEIRQIILNSEMGFCNVKYAFKITSNTYKFVIVSKNPEDSKYMYYDFYDVYEKNGNYDFSHSASCYGIIELNNHLKSLGLR